MLDYSMENLFFLLLLRVYLYLGETLENVSQTEVEDVIERGQTSIQGLVNEW